MLKQNEVPKKLVNEVLENINELMFRGSSRDLGQLLTAGLEQSKELKRIKQKETIL